MKQLQDIFTSLIGTRIYRAPFVNKLAIKITSEIEKLGNVILPWYFRHTSSSHFSSIAEDVVVSLTSFPLRLPCVWLVVECLLRQTVRPGKIVLYLSRQQVPDMLDVPDNLKHYGEILDIRLVDDDLRSHKKYWYAVSDFPDFDIVVVDDDVIYDSRLIERLLVCRARHPKAVIANNFHRMIYDENDEILPYLMWPNNIYKEELSADIFIIGNGGTLYPKGSLSGANDAVIKHLCPLADDIWLNAIIRKNGFTVVPARSSILRVPAWIIPQNQTLASQNATAMAVDNTCYNDTQLDAVRKHFISTFSEDVFRCKV